MFDEGDFDVVGENSRNEFLVFVDFLLSSFCRKQKFKDKIIMQINKYKQKGKIF